MPPQGKPERVAGEIGGKGAKFFLPIKILWFIININTIY
jgi:hypothetical protein